MGLEMLNTSDREEMKGFIQFNRRIFPKRKVVKERFVWQYVDNPVLKDKKNPYVLLYYDEGKLLGQSLLNPFEWYYGGKRHTDYYGCDYYVLEEHRGAGGAALAIKTIRDKHDYFAIGVSEVAQQIWKRLGVRTVGRLDLFVWFRNPLVPFKLVLNTLFRRGSKGAVKTASFPQKITAGGSEFRLLGKIDKWKDYLWKGVVQFARDREFLKWRFFESPFEYYFYTSDSGKVPMYLVVRKFVSKGLDMLLLVDYRVPERDIKSWQAVLEASKFLAKETGCHGVITGSSHSFFDEELKRNSFRHLKAGSVIMTNTEKVDLGEALEKRDMVYATMADSDPDMNFEDPVEMALGKLKNKLRGIFR
jgi:GNAT superfamily N-acetyltransferase